MRSARPVGRRHVTRGKGLLVAAAAVVSFVAAVVGTLNDGWDVVDKVRGVPVAGQPAVDAPSAGSPAAALAGTETSSSLQGAPSKDCVRGNVFVSCDVVHDGEVVGSAPCHPDAATSYLGGASGVDVLSPTIKMSARVLQGENRCVLTLQGQVGSLRDAFTGPGHARLRWCVDTKRRPAGVSCNEPHDGEVVSTATGSCPQRAAAYVGATWATLEDELSVREFAGPTRRGCVVEARGTNVLTGSIRGLGAKALPLTSRA